MPMRPISHPVTALLALLLLALSPIPGFAQGLDLANRPVSEIKVQGLRNVPLQLVENQIRLEEGDPYQPEVVESDIVRITHLGRFSSVTAQVVPRDDGSVALIYKVEEQPLLSDVQVVGNKKISDQELLSLIILQTGDPIDPFLIDRGKQVIREAYEDKGFFTASVSVDEDLLQRSYILIYRIREGPRVRIRGIDFEGNENFGDKQLKSKIKSRSHIFILRKGDLSREQLDSDVARVREHYQNHGYLDVQVGRRIDLSEDQDDAIVTFIIDEGRQYTVGSLDVEGNDVFPDHQIRETMDLNVGDVLALDKITQSRRDLIDMYGKLGYLNTEVRLERTFHAERPQVDVTVFVDEGRHYTAGKVTIRGNAQTKDKVVLRELRGMDPGRRYDRTGIERTEQKLRESSLFSDAEVTVLGTADDQVRDALVEVKEQNTGSISFGAGVSSDAGVVGAIDLKQRNFDIADTPESFGEFFTGRAFRGAGQSFSLTLQPGNERSYYGVNFREPYLLDTDFFLDARFSYFNRQRLDYAEGRITGLVGMGQRFGDVWSAAMYARGESIDISDVEDEAPDDVFAVEGDSMLTSLSFNVTRSTVDSFLFPTSGSRMEASLARVGALGGDYDFWRANVEWRKFWAVDEDFFGRKTVLSLRTQVGHIFETGTESVSAREIDPTVVTPVGTPPATRPVPTRSVSNVPVFERFYAGGHSSFRGFDFRGIGPLGVANDTGLDSDEHIGGETLILLGLEYNYPIYEETLRGVFFVDTGTVTNDFSFDDYRVSVGAGLRLKVPFFGQAPFALDVAFPVVKEEDDDTRLISFAFSLPLN